MPLLWREQRSTSHRQEMAAKIGNFNEDLWVEILHRLTYKESRRYLCVCKTWSRLILEPFFLKKLMIFHHPNHLRPQPFLILSRTEEDNFHHFTRICGGNCIDSRAQVLNRSLDFVPKREGEGIKVFRVSGDLLLCGQLKSSTVPMRAHSGRDEQYYYICNPITRQWVALPPLSHTYGVSFLFHSSPFYAEDPTSIANSIYNPEYEYIVLANEEDQILNKKVKFFSSMVGKWVTISLSFPQDFNVDEEWFSDSYLHEGFLWYFNGTHIIRFNIKDSEQEPLLIDSPRDHSYPDDIKQHPFMGVCCGRFRFAGWYEAVMPSMFLVWELDEEEGGKWSLIHKVITSHLCPDHSVFIRTVHFHPRDRDVMFFDLWEHIVECNARTNDFKVYAYAALLFVDYYRDIMLIPPWYPTPVLPLKNKREDNWFFDPPFLPIVKSIWEQVDVFRALRKDVQVV